MVRVVLVTAVCGAACADIPDRVEDPMIRNVEVSADMMAVTGDLFTLKFASTGVRLPISFVHNDTEMLATDVCPEPSLAGVSLAPMTTAVGGRSVAANLEAANTITAPWTGPQIAQVVVGYQVEYFCNGPQVLDGTSTFTVFPSGRVVRNDAVKPTAGAPLDAANCGGCSAPKGFARFESFWTLAPGAERIELDETGAEQPLTPGALGTMPTTCALYGPLGVAVKWTGNGIPTSEARAPSAPVELRYGFMDLSTTVSNALSTGRSTFAFGPSGRPCSDIAAEVEEPTLVIGGKPIDVSAFGIYEYAEPLRGTVQVRTQRVDGYGHGVALRFEVGAASHLRIEHANGDKVEFRLQPDGDAYLIWLPDGVPHDNPIEIEAS
jgi:hypothetical protein